MQVKKTTINPYKSVKRGYKVNYTDLKIQIKQSNRKVTLVEVDFLNIHYLQSNKGSTMLLTQHQGITPYPDIFVGIDQ